MNNYNEETELQNNMQQVEDNQPQVENIENQDGRENKKPWKEVAFGSAAGILIGAGAIYAVDAYGASASAGNEVGSPDAEEAGNELKVAEVSNDQSFSDAFAEARREVGPGGVFHWHGGIYSTYLAEEWEAMSDEEKAEFAKNVNPEIQTSEIDTNHISDANPDISAPVQPAIHQTIIVNSDSLQTPEPEPTPEPTPEPGRDEDMVEVIGRGTEIGPDGNEYLREDILVEGHEGIQLDLDQDAVADVRLVDWNDNGEADDGEMQIINQEAYDNFMAAKIDVEEEIPVDELAQNDSYDVAPDMPDYDNNGDVGSLA